MEKGRDFLYMKMYNEFKEKIDSGALRPGETLPPECDLVKQ